MSKLVAVFRIGKDAEVRQTDRSAVANLALAYNYGQKGNDGKKPTQWIDASLWGKRAEALEQYLVKGQQVFCVISDLHIETYQTRDGDTKSKLVGTVADIELVGGAPSGERREREAPPRREQREERREKPQASKGGFDDMDDDIPF